mgnify:FL=1
MWIGIISNSLHALGVYFVQIILKRYSIAFTIVPVLGTFRNSAIIHVLPGDLLFFSVLSAYVISASVNAVLGYVSTVSLCSAVLDIDVGANNCAKCSSSVGIFTWHFAVCTLSNYQN